MNFNEKYIALRKWALHEDMSSDYKTKSLIAEEIKEVLVKKSGLDYRTLVGLKSILKDEALEYDDVVKMLDPEFYNYKNCLELARAGLIDIVPVKYFEDLTFLEEAGITYIPENFCTGNKELKSFVVPSCIKTIGPNAFKGCINMETVTFENAENSSLYTIGELAFSECLSLKSIEMPNGLKVLGPRAFEGCIELEYAEIPESLRTIYFAPFNNCKKLKKVKYNSFGYKFREIKGFTHIMDGCRVDGADIENLRQIAFKTEVSNILGLLSSDKATEEEVAYDDILNSNVFATI